MSNSQPLVRDVSDKTRWVAFFRARENQRADALFRRAYAERLAGAQWTTGKELSEAGTSFRFGPGEGLRDGNQQR